jgi:hypothetical protein
VTEELVPGLMCLAKASTVPAPSRGSFHSEQFVSGSMFQSESLLLSPRVAQVVGCDRDVVEGEVLGCAPIGAVADQAGSFACKGGCGKAEGEYSGSNESVHLVGSKIGALRGNGSNDCGFDLKIDLALLDVRGLRKMRWGRGKGNRVQCFNMMHLFYKETPPRSS